MRVVHAAAAVVVVVVALLAAPGRCYIADPVGRSLSRMLDIRTVANGTGTGGGFRVPGYMYELYGDAENRRYDAIRNVRPSTGNGALAEGRGRAVRNILSANPPSGLGMVRNAHGSSRLVEEKHGRPYFKTPIARYSVAIVIDTVSNVNATNTNKRKTPNRSCFGRNRTARSVLQKPSVPYSS